MRAFVSSCFLCLMARAGWIKHWFPDFEFTWLGEEMRDWNLLSKGRKDGVGLLRPGREATEGRTLLLWEAEDTTEPCSICLSTKQPDRTAHSYLHGYRIIGDRKQRPYGAPGPSWKAIYRPIFRRRVCLRFEQAAVPGSHRYVADGHRRRGREPFLL